MGEGSLQALSSLRIHFVERQCFTVSCFTVQRLNTKSCQRDERSLRGFLALPNVRLHSLQKYRCAPLESPFFLVFLEPHFGHFFLHYSPL